MKETNKKGFLIGILSLSLLTVMAGAAIAPALGVIHAYFSDSNPMLVQMIISMPAIFIVITSLCFARLCNKFGMKTLVITGLVLYVVGGCAAGLFSNILLVLVMRALVGIGVGIIMPLSTGLLAMFFPPEKQEALMGYSSAMNQMGGVVATLLSGLLAGISWRAAFLVYLIGLFSLILCIIFMPNRHIGKEKAIDERQSGLSKASPSSTQHSQSIGRVFKKNYGYIVAMFLLMTIFFIYPANFAMVTGGAGLIPQGYIALIMAGMDLIAFLGGLMFVTMKQIFKSNTKFVAPTLFLLGYLCLIGNNLTLILIGSALIGFANGAGVPYIISTASRLAGRSAVVTVMPLLSGALYLSQFLCPFFTSAVAALLGNTVAQLPYYIAVVLSLLFLIWFSLITEDARQGREHVVESTLLASLMKHEVYAVNAEDNLLTAMKTLTVNGISGAPVIDNKVELVGFVSDGDILHFLSKQNKMVTNAYIFSLLSNNQNELEEKLKILTKLKVRDIATKNVISVDINDDLEDVCAVLYENHLKKAPVLEQGKMVGIINRSNITKYVTELCIKTPQV